MPDPQLEKEKDVIIQTMTNVYARGDIDMSAFERAVTRISACSDPRSLEIEAKALGLELPLAPIATAEARAELELPRDAVQLDCVSGNIRKSGDWVKSGSYLIRLKSSSTRLDLREYEGARGFRLHIEIEAASSVVKLTVPKGFEVEDRFTERVSSTVQNKPRGESYGGNFIVLTGSLRSSVVKVKYK